VKEDRVARVEGAEDVLEALLGPRDAAQVSATLADVSWKGKMGYLV
jgi:hypothetical protein